LRGRVGRGADQSYCLLVSSYKLSQEARKRIATMVQTNNGFEIAEADMELRGAGNIHGTQQSGQMDFRIANLATDQKILQTARTIANQILDLDPELNSQANQKLRNQLKKMKKFKHNLGRIS
jgi:ATP-dependent DNA helicase RecG